MKGKRGSLASLLACALIAVLFGCKKAPAITVFAASSLKEVTSEICDRWSKQSGVSVQLQFEASSVLARQIREGAKADLFLSAAPEWIDEVKPLDRYDWLSNRLVVAVDRKVDSFDLKQAQSLALANEQVPAGKYAKAALAKLGIALPQRIIYGSNVRDVLSKISSGAAEAGIVYETDLAVDPTLKIAYVFADETHPPILYTTGLLREEGRGLFEALRAPASLEIAKRRGFRLLHER